MFFLKKYSIAITSMVLSVFSVLCQFIILSFPGELLDKINMSMTLISLLYIYMIYTTFKFRGFNNVFTLILCLSALFYYGQHFVAIFDANYFQETGNRGILSKLLPDEFIIRATFMAAISMLTLHSGFFCISWASSINRNFDFNKRQLKALRIVGWCILLISLYPTIKYLVSLYQLQFLYGYLGRRMMETDDNYLQELGVSRLIIFLSNLFLPSIYALLLGYNGRKYTRLLYVIMLIYIILYLLTGSRFIVLKLVVVVMSIRFSWIALPNRNDIRKLLIIFSVLVVFFALSTTLRGGSGNSVELDDAENHLAISGVLWETGITFTTISNILYCCPNQIDFFYGKSFLGSVLQCLPEFLRFGFFDNNTLSVSAVFSPLYYGTDTNGYGSSFIAEAYYNFGYLMYLFIFLLGCIMGKISKMMIYAINTCSPFLFLFLATLSGELVYGVRNDLSSILRLLLTTSVIIIIFSRMMVPFVKSPKSSFNKHTSGD